MKLTEVILHLQQTIHNTDDTDALVFRYIIHHIHTKNKRQSSDVLRGCIDAFNSILNDYKAKYTPHLASTDLDYREMF